jgi:subtilisin-like proprotein convertase family protein
MECQFYLAFSPSVLAMQRERLQPGFASVSHQTRAPRRGLVLAPRLVAGLLVLLLLAAAVAPAFAGSPHHQQQRSAPRQEHEASAAKKKDGKSKTVTRTFSSDTAIAIPSEGATETISAAAPYPSTLAVRFKKKSRVSDVNLTLRDFSHRFPLDVDVMLVAPGGRNAVVMSDVGGNLPSDEAAVSNLTLTLDDEATEPLPLDEALTSGTFRPVEDIDSDAFPAPAPAPSSIALSTFDGINPNGQWRLFIVDDSAESDDGELTGGWTLEITAKSKVKSKHKKRH